MLKCDESGWHTNEIKHLMDTVPHRFVRLKQNDQPFVTITLCHDRDENLVKARMEAPGGGDWGKEHAVPQF